MAFNNTVVLRKSTTSGEDLSVEIIDGPTNQKTVRSSADGLLTLTVQHQSSNENPGFVTHRSNVRLNLSKEVEETGKSVNGYVQFQMSIPKDVVTVADVQALTARLLNFIATCDADEPGVTVNATEILAPARLLAGVS